MPHLASPSPESPYLSRGWNYWMRCGQESRHFFTRLKITTQKSAGGLYKAWRWDWVKLCYFNTRCVIVWAQLTWLVVPLGIYSQTLILIGLPWNRKEESRSDLYVRPNRAIVRFTFRQNLLNSFEDSWKKESAHIKIFKKPSSPTYKGIIKVDLLFGWSF